MVSALSAAMQIRKRVEQLKPMKGREKKGIEVFKPKQDQSALTGLIPSLKVFNGVISVKKLFRVGHKPIKITSHTSYYKKTNTGLRVPSVLNT